MTTVSFRQWQIPLKRLSKANALLLHRRLNSVNSRQFDFRAVPRNTAKPRRVVLRWMSRYDGQTVLHQENSASKNGLSRRANSTSPHRRRPSLGRPCKVAISYTSKPRSFKVFRSSLKIGQVPSGRSRSEEHTSELQS